MSTKQEVAQLPDYGLILDNGTQITHGAGAQVKDAFPPELNIPGQLQVFNPGHGGDERIPSFSGATGCLFFTTENRMPRHVHMTRRTAEESSRFVVEKILVLNGVALAELSDEIYVLPPMTLVTIGAGVPHAWVACPPGLDLQALGVADEKIISEGHFTAFYEYSEPTAFYPTAQTEKLRSPEDYVTCDDLQSIRFPQLTLDQVIERAWFVWGKKLMKGERC